MVKDWNRISYIPEWVMAGHRKNNVELIREPNLPRERYRLSRTGDRIELSIIIDLPALVPPIRVPGDEKKLRQAQRHYRIWSGQRMSKTPWLT